MRRTLFALTGLALALAASAPAGSARAAPALGARHRDDVRRQRPRLGTRRRHEPVRRARLRERGLDVRPDPRPLLHRHRARPAPVARVRVLVAEARPSVTVRSTVPFRVRDVFGKTYPLPAGDVVLGPKLRVTVNGAPTELAGPIVFLPGSSPLALDRPYRGQIEVGVTGAEAERDQRRRARAVPRRRRAAGDAERLARRGAEGAGGGRALVRALAPARRQGLRPLRRRAQPGLRRRRRRAPAHDGRDRGDRGRGAALGGQADRRALPLDLGRHDARRGRGVRQGRAVPRRRRRSAQRALAGPPLGADAGHRGDDPQGPEAAGAGDGAEADARPLGPGDDRAGRDRGRHDEGLGRDAPRRGRPPLDVDHRAGLALALASRRPRRLREGAHGDGQGRRASRERCSASGSTASGSRFPA